MQPNWRRIVLLVTDINAMYHRRCDLVLDPFFRRMAEWQNGKQVVYVDLLSVLVHVQYP